VTSLAGFVATFFIARVLGAETLGTYAVLVAVLFWVNIPAGAVQGAVIKHMSEGEAPRKYLGGGIVLLLILALIVAGALLIDPGYFNSYVGGQLSLSFVVLFLSSIMYLYIDTSLKGNKRVGVAGLFQSFERVLRTGFQIGLVLGSYLLLGLVVGHAMALFVTSLVGLFFVNVRPSVPDAAQLRELLSYARYSWLGMLKTRSFAWMDTIVLGFFVADSLIGIYEVSWTLASTLALVAVSVRQVLFPEMSDLSSQDEYDRIHHYLNEGMVFTGVFLIPGLFGALVIGPDLLRIYRPEFTRGAGILAVLVVARLIAAFGNQFVNTINAIDRPDIAFRINGTFVVTNLVLNFVLVWEFGWYGAAVATTVSSAVGLGLGYWTLQRLIGRLDVPYLELGKELFASVIMTLSVVAVHSVTPTSHYVTIVLVLFGSAVYGATLLLISSRIRTKAFGLVPVDI